MFSLNLYIDVTADQFNYGIDSENEFPVVLVREGFSHGMKYDEPSRDKYEILEENAIVRDGCRGLRVALEDVICSCEELSKNSNTRFNIKATIDKERWFYGF